MEIDNLAMVRALNEAASALNRIAAKLGEVDASIEEARREQTIWPPTGEFIGWSYISRLSERTILQYHELHGSIETLLAWFRGRAGRAEKGL